MMNPYAIVDDSAFPEVIITFTGERADDDNFTKYLQDVLALYDRKEPLGLIFDASNATTPNVKYQKQQADWLRDQKDLMQNYCKGTAYVIPNPIIRTVLKGIFVFQTQPVPYKVVKTLEEAQAWIRTEFSNEQA
jgi:hypothetical protein